MNYFNIMFYINLKYNHRVDKEIKDSLRCEIMQLNSIGKETGEYVSYTVKELYKALLVFLTDIDLISFANKFKDIDFLSSEIFYDKDELILNPTIIIKYLINKKTPRKLYKFQVFAGKYDNLIIKQVSGFTTINTWIFNMVTRIVEKRAMCYNTN